MLWLDLFLSLRVRVGLQTITFSQH